MVFRLGRCLRLRLAARKVLVDITDYRDPIAAGNLLFEDGL
jgi:hypothetical protein